MTVTLARLHSGRINEWVMRAVGGEGVLKVRRLRDSNDKL